MGKGLRSGWSVVPLTLPRTLFFPNSFSCHPRLCISVYLCCARRAITISPSFENKLLARVKGMTMDHSHHSNKVNRTVTYRFTWEPFAGKSFASCWIKDNDVTDWVLKLHSSSSDFHLVSGFLARLVWSPRRNEHLLPPPLHPWPVLVARQWSARTK